MEEKEKHFYTLNLARRIDWVIKYFFFCVVIVTLEPLPGAETYVNGKQITEGVVLRQGSY